ncbi:MAG: hypothetical protein ACR2NU_00235 [Aeoliella sp.]
MADTKYKIANNWNWFGIRDNSNGEECCMLGLDYEQLWPKPTHTHGPRYENAVEY